MNKPLLRTFLVVAATVFAIAAPIIQNGADLGMSASEFSKQGDGTLRAEGYAFSIWSVIYLGLAAYAVWQALPRTRESAVLRAVAWPSVIGIAGLGVWIVVTALNWRWATVAVIVTCAAAIILALWRAAPESGERRWIATWPLGLLGGWLTAATALNVLTVATAEGLIGAPAPAALAGLAAVGAVTLAVLIRTRSIPYGLAVLWALAGVFVAERGDNPAVAWFALAWGVVIVLAGAYLARTRRA